MIECDLQWIINIRSNPIPNTFLESHFELEIVKSKSIRIIFGVKQSITAWSKRMAKRMQVIDYEFYPNYWILLPIRIILNKFRFISLRVESNQ